jgi:hypothetical protein
MRAHLLESPALLNTGLKWTAIDVHEYIAKLPRPSNEMKWTQESTYWIFLIIQYFSTRDSVNSSGLLSEPERPWTACTVTNELRCSWRFYFMWNQWNTQRLFRQCNFELQVTATAYAVFMDDAIHGHTSYRNLSWEQEKSVQKSSSVALSMSRYYQSWPSWLPRYLWQWVFHITGRNSND